jgi:hypothetical protein
VELEKDIEGLDQELESLRLQVARISAKIEGLQAERDALAAAMTPTTDSVTRRGGRSVYDKLRDHLSQRSDPVVYLSFAEIQQIIGRDLPKSAKRYPAWWANGHYGTNVQARSWLDVGRTATVHLKEETVDFVR